MSTIGVTGATGHLGRHLVNHVVRSGHTVVPIGRTWDDDVEVDALLHLAAPDHRDEDAIRAFAPLNERIVRWSQATGTRVISTGTWWQYAGTEASSLSYTRLKAEQMDAFDTTLILFSVYGTTARSGRGFIPQLVTHCRGGRTLAGASHQRRDWTHADDVVRAYMAALGAPSGVYEVGVGSAYSPAELVRALTGETLPDYVEHPNCSPHHVYGWVPGWTPTIGVLSYLREAVVA